MTNPSLPKVLSLGVRRTVDLVKAGQLAQLKKAVVTATGGSGSSIPTTLIGLQGHLIDKVMAAEIRDYNTTHAICLDAKRQSTLGIGHRDLEIHDVLDPLCRFSWQDVLDALSDDYWQDGECFLEVAFRDPEDPKRVTGLYHIPSCNSHVVVEDQENSEMYHYAVQGSMYSHQVVMARWGDRDDLKLRHGKGELTNVGNMRRTVYGDIVESEVIHIRQSTNKSPLYGYPDYMSAVPSIELVQCMTQHEYDFYFNRGVPEYMLIAIGAEIGGCWEKIEEMVEANQGPGNSHKTAAIHIPADPEKVSITIEKLAMEDAANSGFAEKSDTLDMRICTAHGMPPALANIQIAGKMGAANEGPNAMLTFQKRKLGQAQRNFSRAFANCLAMKGVTFAQPEGAPKALKRDQFLGTNEKPVDDHGQPQYLEEGNGFRTILDGMTLGAQDTLSRMKEPLAGSGRNPADGLLDGADDRKKTDPKKSR
jgi:hypothetical protein